jgi:hypothetical protein
MVPMHSQTMRRHEIHEHDDMIWYDTDETTKQAMLPEQSQTEIREGPQGE